ncbi:MAG: acyl-CoA dehydratase activase [Candidatus Cloacimonas sp.]|jgi:predicted CoA-substrate-specific enzyme activase|nr:acyl-CoA dehydratase activase [Candidatus Cloacimonadota bacterium]
MICAGLDIGSRNTKIVFWNATENRIVHKDIVESGTTPLDTAKSLINKGIKAVNGETNIPIVTTGYGRKLLDYPYISEISCHAKGVATLYPEVRTLIDIGGQDSKAICISEEGIVEDFAMNDKCAAGTGSFLEKVAQLFKLSTSELGKMALKAENNVEISSTCVVFAESEIISLINNNYQHNDILKGVHYAVAMRVKNLLSAVFWQEPVALTGGVALNSAIKHAIEDVLGKKILVIEEPFYTGALGAAIFASAKNT